MEKYRLEVVKWRDVKKIADLMYCDNKYLSPYTDYDFLNRIIKSSNIRLKKRFKRCRFVNYVLYKNDEPIYIAPLFFDKKGKVLFLAGHFNSVGHIDFIYKKDVTKQDFDYLIEALMSNYKNCSIHLDRISQFSKTFLFLSENKQIPIKKEICVKIDFSNYDGWFQSLHKGRRQNIRTAYNRINR